MLGGATGMRSYRKRPGSSSLRCESVLPEAFPIKPSDHPEVTDPYLGLTPIAEQHPTTKTLGTRRRVMSKPCDTFCRLFTLAFATGSFRTASRSHP